jgi:hypothetical protein
MSDARLRELERRWRETGSVQDEAAYLIERKRGGTLSAETLDLAAFLGHAAAVEATGPVSESAGGDWFATLLQRLGPGAAVRVAAAFAQEALSVWESAVPEDRRPRHSVEAALRWAESCPVSDDAVEAAEAAGAEASEAGREARRDRRDGAVVAAAFGAMGAARCAYWAAMGGQWHTKLLEDCRWVAQRCAEALQQGMEDLRATVSARLARQVLTENTSRDNLSEDSSRAHH